MSILWFPSKINTDEVWSVELRFTQFVSEKVLKGYTSRYTQLIKADSHSFFGLRIRNIVTDSIYGAKDSPNRIT